MNTVSSGLTYQDLLDLSNRLNKASGLRQRLVTWYWSAMYILTRLIEKLSDPQSLPVQDDLVLNFGCGVHFTRGVNSDLFAIHRYVKRRRRPDLYLSGTSV